MIFIIFWFLGLLDPIIIEKEEKKEQRIERNHHHHNQENEEEEEEEEVGEIYNLNIIQEEEEDQRNEKKKKKKRVQFFPNLGTEETIHENSKRKQSKYQIFSHDTNNNESSNQSIISLSSNKIIHLSDQSIKRTSTFK